MMIVARAIRRCLVGLVAIATLVVAMPTPVSAAAPVDAERLALRFGGRDSRLTRPLGYPRELVTRGSWSVESGWLRADGRLELEITMDPPEVGLPLDPGSATLFGSLDLFGGQGGDMGAGGSVGQPIHTPVQQCRPEQGCELRARVVLPADRIEATAARNPNAISWSSLDVNLVLVRTFGQGTWIQVLQLGKANGAGAAGTLAAPRPVQGSIGYRGLFPASQGQAWLQAEPPDVRYVPTLEIADRQRRRGDDRSASPHSVAVQLDFDAGECAGWSLMTETGDVAYEETRRLLGRQSHVVDVPVGSSWYVRSPSPRAVEGWADTSQSFGPFTAGDAGLGLFGSWTCDTRGGEVTSLVGAMLEAPSTEDGLSCPADAVEPIETQPVVAGEWATIAPAPMPGRYDHTATWTGNEVIIWGGIEPTDGDGPPNLQPGGAAYDPRSDTWRRVSEAPIAGRTAHTAVWTGKEMIIWGGRSEGGLLHDGAAYDPSTDSWRTIDPRQRGLARHSHHAIWTGKEMIVWSGYRTRKFDRRPRTEGLAYEPDGDTWRNMEWVDIADRIGDAAVWAGDRLIAAGYGDDPRASMAAYDPTRDRWAYLPWVEISSEGRAAPLWTGSEVLWLTPDRPADGSATTLSAAYRVPESCWASVSADVPPHSSILEPVWGDGLAIFAGSQSVAYEPASDSWRSLPAEASADRVKAPVVWAGDRLFLWGGRSGDSGDVVTDGLTFTPGLAPLPAEPSAPATAEPSVQSWTSEGIQATSDLRAIAEANGWTIDQSKAQERASQAVAGISSAVFEEQSDIYIGGALSEEPGGAPSLYIKGPAPQWVLELVAEADGPIIVVDEQPYSFDELEARKDRVHQALVEAGYPNVATGIHISGGGVIPVSLLSVTGLPADPEEILAFVPEELRADVRLDVTIAPPRPSAEPGTWGPLAAVYQPGGFGPGVGLGAVRLRIGEACVWIESKQGRYPTTLVFEGDHVDWRPTSRRIVFTDRRGDTVRLSDGDRIEGGGVSLWPPQGPEGESGPAPRPEPGRRWDASLDEAWLQQPDASCPERLFFLSEVTVSE